MKKIILASASPRRQALLAQLGLSFEVDPSHFEEGLNLSLEPHALAREIANRKAEVIAKKYRNAIIIAADTFGLLEGRIIGKPRTESEAREMLGSLNGKAHLVITGFTIIDTGTGKKVSRSEETRVYIRRLSREEIEAYVRTGEPLDKAGAYAIQGLGAVLIARLEGDCFNVMGLPLGALSESLKEFGVDVLLSSCDEASR